MDRVLITGATGFLGGAVARALHGGGFQVIATGRCERQGHALEQAGLDFRACDLSADAAAVSRLTAGCNAVVHCAALSSPWGERSAFESANVTATRHILAACRAASVGRLIHISSPSVTFDFKDQPLLKENAPWSSRAANAYISTKREAECLVRAATDLNTIILRPKALFGPGDTTLLPRLIRVAKRGSFPLFGEGDPLMDLTLIDDAVHAVRLALKAPEACKGKAYHVTSGDPRPRSAVLSTMITACGLPCHFRRIPLSAALTVASLLEATSRLFTLGRWEPPITRYSVGALAYEQTLDISAARQDLGFAPTTDLLHALTKTGSNWRTQYQPPA